MESRSVDLLSSDHGGAAEDVPPPAGCFARHHLVVSGDSDNIQTLPLRFRRHIPWRDRARTEREGVDVEVRRQDTISANDARRPAYRNVGQRTGSQRCRQQASRPSAAGHRPSPEAITCTPADQTKIASAMGQETRRWTRRLRIASRRLHPNIRSKKCKSIRDDHTSGTTAKPSQTKGSSVRANATGAGTKAHSAANATIKSIHGT